MSLRETPILKQAESYRRYAVLKANAHFYLCEQYRKRHNSLGVFVTLFSSIVGTTIFATITNDSPSLLVSVITGSLSVIAAVLSGFLTFFRFSDISQQHKVAAASFESVRHSLTLLLLEISTVSGTSGNEYIGGLKQISKELSTISQSAPTIPDHVWDMISAKMSISPVLTLESSE